MVKLLNVILDSITYYEQAINECVYKCFIDEN
jgi:hypothetical protein